MVCPEGTRLLRPEGRGTFGDIARPCLRDANAGVWRMPSLENSGTGEERALDRSGEEVGLAVAPNTVPTLIGWQDRGGNSGRGYPS